MTTKQATWIDFLVFAKDADTGKTMAIFILEPSGNVAVDLDADTAREVADRLVAMADEWDQEKTRPPLRRLPDVDEQLRGLDD